MERIASFCVDHTRLERGMYLSRQDGDVLTWDIRMKKPNQGDYLTTAAAHTLELHPPGCRQSEQRSRPLAQGHGGRHDHESTG